MKKLIGSLLMLGLVCSIVACLPLIARAQYYPSQSQPPVYYQPHSPTLQAIKPVPIPPPTYPSYPSYPSSPCPPTGGGYWNSEQCMYQQALQMVYARQYYGAIQAFAQFLQYYPRSSLADNALYWTGECYYAMKQYSTALSYFQWIPYQYPRGNKVPDSLLKSALCYFSMKQDARGCQVLNDLLRRYPRSESARKGYRWLNRCGGSGCYQPVPVPYNQGCPPTYYHDYSFPKNY